MSVNVQARVKGALMKAVEVVSDWLLDRKEDDACLRS